MAVESRICYEDFEIQQLLAHGCYASVYKVIKKTGRDAGVAYAMKRMMLCNSSSVKCVQRERLFLSRISDCQPLSLFLPSLFYSFFDGDSPLFVMTLAGCCDLYDVIQKYGSLNETDTRFYLAELVCAVEFLHERNIVHMDIKPENVILDSSGHISLCDFDRAFDLDLVPEPSDYQGTVMYMAPEVAREEAITVQADVWSIGVVVAELIGGPIRNDANSTEEMWRLAKDGRYNFKPSPPASKPLLAFINMALKKNYKDRPNVQQLKGMRYLKPIKWNVVVSKALKPPIDPRTIERRPGKSKTDSNGGVPERGVANVDDVNRVDFEYVHLDVAANGSVETAAGQSSTRRRTPSSGC